MPSRRLIGRHFGSSALIALACLAICWVAFVHFRSPILPYDDAFIAYRYVHNFAQGDGLVYNAGERGWGYSTVTYIFWLSAWHLLLPHVALPELAIRTNAIPFIAVGLALFLLVLRFTESRILAAFAALLVLLNPGLLAISIGGMEPFLFVALMSLSFLAADKPAVAGALAALSILTRVEGLALVPILGLYCYRQRSSLVDLIRMMVAMFSPLAAWLAFAWMYYGTLVPHSIQAKGRPLYVRVPLSAFFQIVNNLTASLSVHGVLASVFVLSALCVSTIVCLTYRQHRITGAWTVPLFFWCMVGMYLYGNPLLFEWYWPLLLVPALVTLTLGASRLLALTSASHTLNVRLAAGVIAGSWAIWMCVANVNSWRAWEVRSNNPNWPVSEVRTEPGRLRCNACREAAVWLNGRRKLQQTVLAPEIGALGYYLNGKLIDGCGLVSPEVIPYLPVPAQERINGDTGSIPLAFVRDTEPDYIVTMPVFALKNVLDDPWAKEKYTVVAEFGLATPVFGSDRVLVLKNRQSVGN